MTNELVPFLLRHCAAGVAAGWLAVALLLWSDAGGIGALVSASDLWPLPLLMLLAGFGVTFGGAAMGAAIMGLGRDDGPPAARRVAPVAWRAARRRGGGFNGG